VLLPTPPFPLTAIFTQKTPPFGGFSSIGCPTFWIWG
jgi:hypothetical protein